MKKNCFLFPPLGVGILTVLLVLVVLLLASFAVMSVLSANADANLTDLSCKNVTAYYAADTQAEQRVLDIKSALGQQNWQEALDGLAVTVSTNDENALICFDIPICDHTDLHVQLRQPLRLGRPVGNLTRILWQTAPRE